MTSLPVISNASPLIALEQIGHLGLLKGLFPAVLIPPSVARELAPTVTLPAWVSERAVTQPIGPQILRTALGPGESEAIALALEICWSAFAGGIILAALGDNGADLRVLEFEVVLKFVDVHDAGNGSSVLLQNQVLRVEVDLLDQRAEIVASLGGGNRSGGRSLFSSDRWQHGPERGELHRCMLLQAAWED